ncbi:DUF924 family protein [Microvirga subterranea]|uniref:Uncharacterized protein (DUF924 family) n=1 Tax=Microvirga subterranea TaxID=186651 RepID=A0A370HJD5_9HYPH|nr:DUF924 family protein [Microvirga subterranea]RDI58639.1 uncharacterized protein (DUF924 family) [Microvirga subterranea]
MTEAFDWRPVYRFWFPPDVRSTDIADHWRLLQWWMGGGANGELARFAPVLEAAKAGRLGQWLAEPEGRLSLIIVLDQFTRGLLADTREAFASDAEALGISREGLENGHYKALAGPWERFFFLLPLAHAEGPDHSDRMERVVAMSEEALARAPAFLRPVFAFSLSQARAHRDVIARFGRFPHRNAVLGRVSTPEELAYLEKGDFVYNRRPPVS